MYLHAPALPCPLFISKTLRGYCWCVSYIKTTSGIYAPIDILSWKARQDQLTYVCFCISPSDSESAMFSKIAIIIFPVNFIFFVKGDFKEQVMERFKVPADSATGLPGSSRRTLTKRMTMLKTRFFCLTSW